MGGLFWPYTSGAFQWLLGSCSNTQIKMISVYVCVKWGDWLFWYFGRIEMLRYDLLICLVLSCHWCRHTSALCSPCFLVLTRRPVYFRSQRLLLKSLLSICCFKLNYVTALSSQALSISYWCFLSRKWKTFLTALFYERLPGFICEETWQCDVREGCSWWACADLKFLERNFFTKWHFLQRVLPLKSLHQHCCCSLL